jgi:hypothetical protein
MVHAIPSYGPLEVAEEWDKGVQLASAEIEKDPHFHFNYCARARFWFHMSKPGDALRDFKQCDQLNPLKGELCELGVAYWWLRQPDQAAQSWRGLAASARTLYTEFPDFSTSPSFLYFAGVKLRTPEIQEEARNYLKAIWQPRRAQVWPFPIAGFLLREMDEETFLLRQTFSNPVLEGRRLCRAFFWVGLRRFEEGDEGQYYARLSQVIDLRQTVPAVTLQTEYWLAQAELELRRPGRTDKNHPAL